MMAVTFNPPKDIQAPKVDEVVLGRIRDWKFRLRRRHHLRFRHEMV